MSSDEKKPKSDDDAMSDDDKKPKSDDDSDSFRAMELRRVSGALIGFNRYGAKINIIK